MMIGEFFKLKSLNPFLYPGVLHVIDKRAGAGDIGVFWFGFVRFLLIMN